MKAKVIIGAVLVVIPNIVLAWVLPVYNTTAYPALVGVEYLLCSSDTVVIQPGKQANVNAQECLVTDIKVTLGEIKPINTPIGIMNIPTHVVQTIHWKVPGHRDFSATIAQQPNGKYDINANYGTQLPQQVIQAVDAQVIQPINQKVIQPINQKIIQPINQNVIQPVVAIGETFENIVSMAMLIKNMIPPIRMAVEHITTQITTLSKIKNGKEIVDPMFAMIEELTALPPHFQAILDKIAESMVPLEVIVRPSNSVGADKIRDAARAIQSVSQQVHAITGKIIELEKILHVRVKTMAESADQATSAILSIVK